MNSTQRAHISELHSAPTKRPTRDPRWQRYVDVFLPICLSIVIGMGFGFSFSHAEANDLAKTHYSVKKSGECEIYDYYVSEP